MSTPRAPRAVRARLRVGVLVLATGLLLALPGTAALAQEEAGPLIDVVEIDGTLDRPQVGHLRDALATAEADGAEVLVVALDSPGALGPAWEGLVEQVLASEVPVAVWVGPTGARATGAAAVLAHAADVLALAPGATLGAAAPADLGMAATPALAAQLAGRLAALAARRGRDATAAAATASDGIAYAVLPAGVPVELGEDVAIPRGVARAEVLPLSERGAVDQGVVDMTAIRLDDVLRELDGREVQVGAAGSVRALDVDPVTARVRFQNPGLVRRILHAAADPTLAYVLVVAGALAIAFELFQPGFGVSGVAGLLVAALGVYGLVVLPVSWLAFGLLVASLALLAADLALGRLGGLSAAGALGFAVGSWRLVPGSPVLGLSSWLIAAVTVAVVVFFVFLLTVVLRQQGTQAMAGAERVIGQIGVVRSTLNPGGHVFVAGGLWRARAPEAAGRVRTGAQVRVVGMNDENSLDVELVDAGAPAGR